MYSLIQYISHEPETFGTPLVSLTVNNKKKKTKTLVISKKDHLCITNPSRAFRIEQVDWFFDYRIRAYGALIYMQWSATIVDPQARDIIYL
jgi:hypothetical protein